MPTPYQLLIRALNKALYLGVWVAGTKHEHDGVRIRTWLSEDEAREPSAKVGEALSLIRNVTPSRFADLRADFRGIMLWDLDGTQGRWQYNVGVCMLDESFVQRTDIERLAMTIVHEAMHAKHWRHGIEYPEELRPRLEALCYRASAAFARRLRNSAVLQAEVSKSFDRPDEYWSDEAFNRRQLRQLERLSMPGWLRRFIRRRAAGNLSGARDA